MKPSPKKKSVRTRKEIKFNRIERALIFLARQIEILPDCEYRVREDILEILGLEIVPPKSKAKKTI